MKIVVGREKDQIELAGVKWVMTDTCCLMMHADGTSAVIEEEQGDEDK